MTDIINNIDAILYINLEYRTDRKEHILNEIHKICTDESKIHRIDAIVKTPGSLGCGLSHIKALEYTQLNKWKTVLILEDDFTFKDNIDIMSNIKSLFEFDFDVGLLANNHFTIKYVDTQKDNIKKVFFSQTASAYIIKSQYIPMLLDNFYCATNSQTINGELHENCIDVHWSKLHEIHNWYTLFPAIGYQYPSYSDNAKTYVDLQC